MTEPEVKVLMLKGEKGDGLSEDEMNKARALIGTSAADIDKIKGEVLNNTKWINYQQSELDTHENELQLNRTDIQDIRGVGGLKDIELLNENGDRLVDNGGVGIGGQRWLINTDKTLSQVDLPADAKAVGDRLNDQQSELDTHENELQLNHTDIQDIRGVGGLKDIELLNENGDRLVDNSGAGIGGQRWLINTDKTLSQADLPADAKAVGDALITKPDAYDIPILYLYGDGIPSLQTKSDSLSDGIRYSFPKFNTSGNLDKIKVQGSSSAALAKKNYTLKFDHSVEIFPEYGKQNKYVIKADMTDFSRVRNTGCAEIWGKVRQTRIKADDAIKLNDADYLVDNSGNHIVGESDPQLSIGGTYGAIDGFPIAVYINNRYWGLYSFNVPKDAWMAKMTKKVGHAIVSATWTQLDKPIKFDGNDMEIEFCGTKDTAWVVSSINTLVNTLDAHYTSAADFDNAISGLLDIDGAIDYYVYSAAIDNTDGVGRNYLLQTWNGKKWYISAYDLDLTFGRSFPVPNLLSPVYNGDNIYRGGMTLSNLASGNRLFYQLWKLHKEDIIARYKELAAGPLSSGAVSTILTNFAYKIPNALLNQEDKTWPQTPLSGISNLSQIRWWYMEHINFLNSLVANN